MNPSVQDRLDSCVRALQHVILPALPAGADLAREQVMLVTGHVQIIGAQLDATPAFEAEEADDLLAMAEALAAAAGDRAIDLCAAMAASADTPPRDRTAALQDAIDGMLRSYAAAGGVPAEVTRIVCDHGAHRAQKDRVWFSAMGFDVDFTGAPVEADE